MEIYSQRAISIQQNLRIAMSDMWWSPPSLTIINRPEIYYSIDPKDNWNVVGYIDSHSEQLPYLVEEVSLAHQEYTSTYVTYPDYDSQLFSLLQQYDYQSKNVHDIRYLDVNSYKHRSNPKIATKIITKKEELILLEQTEAQAFDTTHQLKSDEEYEYIVQEYQQERPRAIRVIAFDTKTGQPVGSGGMSLFEKLNVCFFFAGGTVPEFRNKGVYSTLISARIQYAQQRGISVAGVFARQQSSAPIVSKQGFEKCGEMTYWKRTPSMSG